MNPEHFNRIAESLRQYRRSDLKDFEADLGPAPVAKLYVDPLPNDAVLKSVLTSNTTFLLGRKGTGKSTVFARAQLEIRDRRDLLSCYIDVKRVFDVTDVSGSAIPTSGLIDVDDGVCRSHLLRKAFLSAVVMELIKEVDGLCQSRSLWDYWRGATRSFESLKTKLGELNTRLQNSELKDQELPVLERITKSWKSKSRTERSATLATSASAKVSPVGMSLQANASATDFAKALDDQELYDQYSEMVLRSFPFNELITEIQELIRSCDLSRLVIFFDDLSELNWLDQRLFVDVVLAPLNNASNDAVKLKVAGYPGRIYYGRIDPTKVDTINLDFAAIYEAVEVQQMEKSATDYTQRLIEARFGAFGEDPRLYFDSGVPFEDHMRLLFQCTFNVPRLMGALLHICYLDRVASGQTITQAAVRLAARKYYEQTIMRYFDIMNKYALEPFANKLDRHNQDQLLKAIVVEARRVRRGAMDGSIGGTYFKGLASPPTSHFVVSSAMADIFSSLEANFLLSKYKDTRDKDGSAVSVFAINYGLIELERMSWGYPPGREYRNYFVQRCFDFTSVMHDFLSKNQTIRRGQCAKSFPLDQKASFELYSWRCPDCNGGVCSVINLSSDFEKEVAQLRTDLMLENVELNILQVLNNERKKMRAGEISALLDVTHQLVGHRTSKLRDMGLVEKRPDEGDGHMKSELTEKAGRTYFDG